MRLVLTLAVLAGFAPAASAQDTLTCDLAGYRAQAGLTAAMAGDTLSLTWVGDRNQELRMQLVVRQGTPTIRDLAIRRSGGQWATVVSNATPEFGVVTGMRRVTNQQLQPLKQLGVPITPELIEEIKWDAFWDAPLHVPGNEPGRAQNNPGLPRKPEEIRRATATYAANGCTVKTNGARLEISFPGVQLGVFAGRLQFTVYKGTNLIQQEVIATTNEPSVAYIYSAGLKGLPIEPASRVVWRDPTNVTQTYRFGGAASPAPTVLRTANRLVVAEGSRGSVAIFPPPHRFFWMREVEFNLGYNWYRKDSASSFSLGVRQAESEGAPEVMGRGAEDYRQNYSLYSARPGTSQRMPVYLYVSPDSGEATFASALAFTRQDRFKAIPGYQVMATHFHSAMVGRLRQLGGLNVRLPDLDVIKAAGINIFAPIDGSGLGFGMPNNDPLKTLAEYYEVARLHSDKDFLIMPNDENSGVDLGGHHDLLLSKPVFWLPKRGEGQPLVEMHPQYGKVYNLGSPADLIEMTERENALIFMPHPRSKGSTGYPDAIKNAPHFLHANYRGIGMRWGIGVDGSETRLCEYRCQALLDEMNNWMADLPTPLKHVVAITESYQKGHGDDIYANNPVNYLKLDTLPGPDDWSPVIDTMRRGDYFWTSGEVLIPSYEVQGTGAKRTISAEVEWTFPLDFVEVVWGDGNKVDRQIISASHLAPFSRQRFSIPFDATGKKWVRFAAWDIAGNGAMVQPIRVAAAPNTD
jgi:hypothetical protein